MAYKGNKTSRVKRARTHGFRNRNSSATGRTVLKRRRLKGRKQLAISVRQ